MAKSLIDWSALDRLKIPSPGVDVSLSKPAAPAPSAAAEVLSYFSRKAQTGAKAQNGACAGPDARPPQAAALTREIAELRSALKAAQEKAAAADTRAQAASDAAAGAKSQMSQMVAAEAQTQAQLCACQRKCAQLQAQIDAQRALAPESEPSAEVKGLLKAPPDFTEAFAGEIRELIISSIAESAAAAQGGGRERRAAVLAAVLAANPATKVLEGHCAQLKQILKDSAYNPNPAELERLGFRLISGRHHWKLEYAGMRMTLAKTPSDYRANLNISAELINRCF